MKDLKTTIAGFLTGAPVVIDAIVTAYQSGAFTGKSTLQVIVGIGIILLGLWTADAKKATPAA